HPSHVHRQGNDHLRADCRHQRRGGNGHWRLVGRPHAHPQCWRLLQILRHRHDVLCAAHDSCHLLGRRVTCSLHLCRSLHAADRHFTLEHCSSELRRPGDTLHCAGCEHLSYPCSGRRRFTTLDRLDF